MAAAAAATAPATNCCIQNGCSMLITISISATHLSPLPLAHSVHVLAPFADYKRSFGLQITAVTQSECHSEFITAYTMTSRGYMLSSICTSRHISVSFVNPKYFELMQYLGVTLTLLNINNNNNNCYWYCLYLTFYVNKYLALTFLFMTPVFL